VREVIKTAGLELKKDFENLIKGTPAEKQIHPSLTFSYLEKDEKAIWTLLLHTGYLTLSNKYMNERGQTFGVLSVPNKEVMYLYEEIVRGWFDIKGTEHYNDFIKALADENVDEFCGFIKKYINESSSYFDFGEKTPEQVFHALMLGLVVGFGGEWDISSNKEAGKGRYDLIMKPKIPGKKGIILEFKTTQSEKTLLRAARSALTQINKKNYIQAFKTGEVLCIGIAFCGKELRYAHKTLQVDSFS
jgi:hypothetical protein